MITHHKIACVEEAIMQLYEKIFKQYWIHRMLSHKSYVTLKASIAMHTMI